MKEDMQTAHAPSYLCSIIRPLDTPVALSGELCMWGGPPWGVMLSFFCFTSLVPSWNFPSILLLPLARGRVSP